MRGLRERSPWRAWCPGGHASANRDTIPDAGRPADPYTLPGSADTYTAIHLRASSYGDAVPDTGRPADPHILRGGTDTYATAHLYPCSDPDSVSHADSTAHGNAIPNPPAHTDVYPRTPVTPTPQHAEHAMAC